jgi:hypothetical protein
MDQRGEDVVGSARGSINGFSASMSIVDAETAAINALPAAASERIESFSKIRDSRDSMSHEGRRHFILRARALSLYEPSSSGVWSKEYKRKGGASSKHRAAAARFLLFLARS